MVAKTVDPEFLSPNVLANYEIIGKIARGCYGLVWKCRAYATGERKYAVKRIINAFGTARDAQKTYREIIFLLELNGHANIVEIFDVVKCRYDLDIYVVTEFLNATLANVLKNTKLTADHLSFITYQLVRGLLYIHTAGIVHRDIKPQNILLNSECRVKICDFGQARTLFESEEDEEDKQKAALKRGGSVENADDGQPQTMNDPLAADPLGSMPGAQQQNKDVPKTYPVDPEGIMSNYVISRWYRPPELLLGSTTYDTSADMWSLGCVIAELFLLKPLFKGTCTYTQLEAIYFHLGKPDKFDLLTLDAPYSDQMFQASLVPNKRPLDAHLQTTAADEEVIDFMELLLLWSPPKRMSADEALRHPYLSHLHNPDDEPRFREPVELPLADDELFTVNDYRDRIYADVLQIPRAVYRVQMKEKEKADAEEEIDDGYGEIEDELKAEE